jgi:molecular chaperone IbpA
MTNEKWVTTPSTYNASHHYTTTTNPFIQIENWFNDPFFLGFNDQFVRWESNKKTTSSFPPYNVKKIDEDNYTIELAVAGYSREDLDVKVEKDTLTIKSDKDNDDKSDFLHRGIAGRNFTQHFTLGEYMVVKSAELENGMLLINIERELPEEAKPKTIKIK